MVHFDLVLGQIGEFGRYQKVLFLLMGLVAIPTGMHNLSMVFLGGEMDFACWDPDLHVSAMKALLTHPEVNGHFNVEYELTNPNSQLTQNYIQNLTGEWSVGLLDQDQSRDIFSELLFRQNSSLQALKQYTCLRPANVQEWHNESGTFQASNETDMQKCDAWAFDRLSVFRNTIVSQWNLVCDREWMVAMATTIYMLGFLVGTVLFGSLSDRYGRHKVLVITLVVASLVATAAAFAPGYIVFVVLRCIVGACTGGAYTTCFVILMEMIGPSWRVLTGVFIQSWFALGVMIMSGVAYLVRDFKSLQLIVAVPPIALISYWWLVPESPRWLISATRQSEAKFIVDKIAKYNGRPSCKLTDLDTQESNKNEALSKEKVQKTATIVDLFRTPNLRIRTLIVYFIWFVVSLVYYGLSLGTGALGGNLYLNNFLSGTMEIPGCVIAVVTINRFGRKRVLMMSMLVAGLTCLAASFSMTNTDLDALTITLAMIGKCTISTAFAIVYIYSSEVFPTVVRNVGVGSGSMCARIGSLLSPQIARLKVVWPKLPFMVFSLMPLAAVIMIMFLPETLGRQLPETIADGECFGQTNMPCDMEVNGQDEGARTPFDTNQPGETDHKQAGNRNQQDGGVNPATQTTTM